MNYTRIKNSYTTLNVEFNSDIEIVKKAHRALIKRYHPDLYANKPELRLKADEFTKTLNLALEEIKAYLKDSAKRNNIISEERRSNVYEFTKPAQNERYFGKSCFGEASFSTERYSTKRRQSVFSSIFAHISDAYNFVLSQTYAATVLFALWVLIEKARSYAL